MHSFTPDEKFLGKSWQTPASWWSAN